MRAHFPKVITVYQSESELITYRRGDGYSANFDAAYLGAYDTLTQALTAIKSHKLSLIEDGLIDTGILETAEAV